MRTFIILFALILFACNTKKESEKTSELTYLMLIDENNKYNEYLTENIEAKILKNKEIESIKIYDSLTKEYLNYLKKIEAKISDKTTEFFFKNELYSETGKEFISKTRNYKLEIEKLVSDQNLKKRINLTLNTNDVLMPENNNNVATNNEVSEKIVGKTYLPYLNYYYKDLSKNQTLAFLNNKKKNVLEIENDFVTNKAIKY